VTYTRIPDFEDFKPDVVYNDNLKNVQKITLTKSDFNVRGDINNNENKKIHQKFNGLIGPILLFNDKIIVSRQADYFIGGVV